MPREEARGRGDKREVGGALIFPDDRPYAERRCQMEGIESTQPRAPGHPDGCQHGGRADRLDEILGLAVFPEQTEKAIAIGLRDLPTALAPGHAGSHLDGGDLGYEDDDPVLRQKGLDLARSFLFDVPLEEGAGLDVEGPAHLVALAVLDDGLAEGRVEAADPLPKFLQRNGRRTKRGPVWRDVAFRP